LVADVEEPAHLEASEIATCRMAMWSTFRERRLVILAVEVGLDHKPVAQPHVKVAGMGGLAWKRCGQTRCGNGPASGLELRHQCWAAPAVGISGRIVQPWGSDIQCRFCIIG